MTPIATAHYGKLTPVNRFTLQCDLLGITGHVVHDTITIRLHLKHNCQHLVPGSGKHAGAGGERESKFKNLQHATIVENEKKKYSAQPGMIWEISRWFSWLDLQNQRTSQNPEHTMSHERLSFPWQTCTLNRKCFIALPAEESQWAACKGRVTWMPKISLLSRKMLQLINVLVQRIRQSCSLLGAPRPSNS